MRLPTRNPLDGTYVSRVVCSNILPKGRFRTERPFLGTSRLGEADVEFTSAQG